MFSLNKTGVKLRCFLSESSNPSVELIKNHFILDRYEPTRSKHTCCYVGSDNLALQILHLLLHPLWYSWLSFLLRIVFYPNHTILEQFLFWDLQKLIFRKVHVLAYCFAYKLHRKWNTVLVPVSDAYTSACALQWRSRWAGYQTKQVQQLQSQSKRKIRFLDENLPHACPLLRALEIKTFLLIF